MKNHTQSIIAQAVAAGEQAFNIELETLKTAQAYSYGIYISSSDEKLYELAHLEELAAPTERLYIQAHKYGELEAYGLAVKLVKMETAISELSAVIKAESAAYYAQAKHEEYEALAMAQLARDEAYNDVMNSYPETQE